MANTLTGLIPSLYAGLHIVSRELVGFIPAVSRDSSAERAAVGQEVRFAIAPQATTADVTPAMVVPEPDDKTMDFDFITISKSKQTNFGFVGEEQLGLNNNGAGVNEVQAQLFAEGLRVLVNEIETDIAVDMKAAASNAYEAGGTPFASGVGDSAQVRKLLNDNGAPASDRHMVLNTTTAASMMTNTQLTRVDESGDTGLVRQGVFNTLHGFMFRETGQGGDVATTAASGYLINGTPAVGATSLPVDTGSGAIAAGETFTIAGDSTIYVVAEADAGPATSITINRPGLKVAPANNAALTFAVTSDALVDMAFHRRAYQLATRAPALPTEGDAAVDRVMLVDPRSGMAFEVSIYTGYRKVRYEVAAAWGYKAIDPPHIIQMNDL